MIVIIDRDHVYTYNLNVETFWQLYNGADEESRGIISPEERSKDIRAKNDIRRGKESYTPQKLADVFPEIEACYCVTAEGLLAKPFTSLEDIDYYSAPNSGEKFTCKVAYIEHLSTALPQLETLVVDKNDAEEVEVLSTVNTDIVQTDDAAVVEDDSVTIGLIDESETDVVVEEPTSTDDTIVVEDDIVIDDEVEETVEGPQLDDTTARILDSFDKLLDGIPNLQSTFGRELLPGIHRLVIEDDREAKVAVLEGLLPEEIFQSIMIASRFNNIVIDNNFGQSTDFIDSITVFPVYSIILSKKNLDRKFSYLDAIGSEFIRFCPIGIVENELVQGFIQKIEITNKDITVVKKMLVQQLKDMGVKASSLTDAEKLAVFEEIFAEYVEERFGNIVHAEGTLLVDSLNGYLGDLDDAGYSIARLKDEFGGFNCDACNYLVFDNRPMIDGMPVPILDTVAEKFSEQDFVVVEEDGFKPEPGVIYLGGRTVHDASDLDEFNAVVADEETAVAIVTDEVVDEVIIEGTEDGSIVDETIYTPESVSAEPVDESSIADEFIQRFINDGILPNGTLDTGSAFFVAPDAVIGTPLLGGVDPVTGMYIDKDGKRYQNEALFRKINGLPELPDEEEKGRRK